MRAASVCLILSFLATPLVAQETIESAGAIGAAGVSFKQPYRSLDDQITVLPVFFVQSGRFRAEPTEISYRLNGGTVSFSLLVQPRTTGYAADDSPVLAGMDDREWTADGGILMTIGSQRHQLRASVVHDLLSRHKGSEAAGGYQFTNRMKYGQLTFRAGAAWQSDRIPTYYYGVRPSEATAARPAYESDAIVVGRLELSGFVFVHRKVALVAGIKGEQLPSSVEDSPIVDGRTNTTMYGGVVFRLW